LHISELEIDNFKSFVKKTKIPFFEGFTVISGPNGSGKSNIIDAILFVLALSGSRSLRAEKLTDLINLNSGRNMAEVSLTFSDGTKIRRRIKRTGSGYYSYNYLNDRLCKQNDVIELLAKAGITPHGYNVVMQGDITRIIEMSDFERRKILDEIAGVAEFDAKKDQALGELEIVRERIEREELLLHELEDRLGELSREREQALEYRSWQEKLSFYQTCRLVANLREKEKELVGLSRLIEDQSTEQKRVLSDRSLEENELTYLRADKREIDDQINEKSGSEYLRLIAELEEAKGGIRLAEQTIQRLNREKETHLETLNRNYLDVKRSETRVAECSDAVRTLSIDRANLAMEAATVRSKVERLNTELSDKSRKGEGARDQLFALMRLLEEKKGERAAVLREMDMLLEKSRLRTTEKERLEEQVTSLDREIEARRSQGEGFSSGLGGIKAKRETIEREMSRLQTDLLTRRSALEKVRNEIRAGEQELVRLETLAQARGEGSSGAMGAVMGMDGVFGTIAQLGKAPAEFALALNVAAGGKLHHVVVSDDEVATGAIKFLKEENLGRLTFLPLNKMKPVPLPPVHEPGVIDYAANLLEYDGSYAPAFRVTFGTTLVADTLAHARKLIGRYRMVTLEGELLERSGAMTGGSFKKQVRGFGVGSGEEIARIRARVDAFAVDAADLESAISRVSADLSAKSAEMQETDQQLYRSGIAGEELEKSCASMEEEKQGLLRSLAQLGEEVKAGGEELHALEKSLESANEAISQTNRDIEEIKKWLSDTEIPALTEHLEKLKREGEDIERRLRNKEADIADIQRERQHFHKRLEELKGDLERVNARNLEIDREVTSAGGEISSCREKIKEIEEKQAAFSSEIADLRKRHTEVLEAVQRSEKTILDLDVAAERIALQLASLTTQRQATFEEVETLREQAAGQETDLSMKEIDDGIAEANVALKKIGDVNMLAIEEYARVEERMKERTGRKDVLSEERGKLLERIESFGRMKHEAFMEAFQAIDTNFRGIFARLTSGSGNLLLENDEDPFAGGLSFSVKPRDKPVHLLSALSGGEKSLTTLAFIFSIQQYIPAPFYAFDEVDMSLDGSNVEHISAMIREHAATSQFIIVSLRKPMIEGADRIMGVTLRADKSSLVTGVKVNA
jgi:chromosome segregation protein